MSNEKICLGYDIMGPRGPIPNCLNPKFLNIIYEASDWYFETSMQYWQERFNYNWPVYNSNFYEHYAKEKSLYHIIEDRKSGNSYDWYYIIEPFGSLWDFLHPRRTAKKNSYEFISKAAINEINNHSGKLLISFVIDGGFFITKKTFLNLKAFLSKNKISEDKVYLVFNDALLEKSLKIINLNVNFYNHNMPLFSKSEEFNNVLNDPNFDYWSGSDEPQVGKLYGKKSTILLYDEFKNNIKSEKKDFLVFSRHWNLQRLLLISKLKKLGLDNSLVSWNKKEYSPALAEEFLRLGGDKELLNLMSTTNSVLDIDDITKIAGYGFETKSLYLETYMSIVTESLFFQGTNINGIPDPINETTPEFISGYLSEKIWKPIGHSHPFIFVGPPKILSFIRDEYGFKTFGEYIDESYDDEMDDWKRWDKLKKLITDFANKTIEQKQKFLSDVASILEYNQKLFLKMAFDKHKYEQKIREFLK
jgi:hypothetical protein